MAGKLSKLRIFSFHDLSFTAVVGTYEAYYNPETYSVTYDLDYCNAEGFASIDSSQRFIRVPPKTYSFDLMIDGTGASGRKVDVPVEVAKFLATTYRFVGTSHRPPFLILSWGTMVEKCVLKSVNVSYTLFSPEGIPLRAKLTTSFESAAAKELIDAIARLSSPDLTHTRIVRQGDTLPLLCKEIYGDESHYLKVARVNNLVNYRNLQVGRELFFPPLNEEN